MQRPDMAGAVRPRVYRRLALMLAASALFLTLLVQRLQGLDPVHVLRAVGLVEVVDWLAAGLATWASFRAVAGYDLALHRHLGTRIAADRATRAGFAAIAIGQTVGLGVLTGGLVRWHMLPELGFRGAMRLAMLVALSFLVAWSVVCATVLALVPGAPAQGWAGMALGGMVLCAVLMVARPAAWMPNLITQGRLLGLAAVDCLAAGFALWLLIPADASFAQFLPVFLLALGAGLVSGAPAGLGAFEITLLALLPQVPEAHLLAGVVAWRIVYYAGPAALGAAVALLARGDAQPVRQLSLPELAEAGLAAQGDFAADPAGFLAGRTRHGLVALGEATDVDVFRQAAKAEGRWPVLYKAPPRMAVRARSAGLTVLQIGWEAWLSPQAFTLDLPARAGLRRKLRRAEAAGVKAAREGQPDWAVLARVNAAWAKMRGGERGFSMGRFDPDYCAGQIVVVARRGGEVAGFATFHQAQVRGRLVWTLDLLRPDPAAPDGTAQALILAAIRTAREEGVERLSLAAVPLGSDPAEAGRSARLMRRLAARSATGLWQFKAGFAPHWQPLYLAGPSRLVLVLVGWEIWRRVTPAAEGKLRPTATQNAEYEIASGRNPWQRGRDRTA